MAQSEKTNVSLSRTIRSVSFMSNYLASIILFLLVILVSAHVIGRYFIALPVPGAVELIQYLMVCVGSLGFAYCAAQQEHVRVELFVERLPRKFGGVLKLISLLLSLGIVALITWQSIVYAIDVWHVGLVSGVLKIPRFPFTVVLVISYVLFTAELIIQVFEPASRALKGGNR
ncbi:MAG: TRAP transporter small permease [Firmicutes bacterium]|nr:TRAP transporter small permease [Bacillota bacterium]